MNRKKLSLSIPYKQRLDNIRIVFEALANQTMDCSEFEVIVGAMEYSQEYVALCKKFTDRINIVSVLSADSFSIPHARNLAMRQATGQIIVQMDADTLLPATALQNLYDRHFAFGQNICVVGQVVGYGNNSDNHIESVETQSYAEYQKALEELGNSRGNPADPRFQVEHIIPWAFGWTGFIALPLHTVHRHQLYFDEEFRGWGVEDLEWSYRICKTGTPIVLCEDVYAIHLPHARNQSAYHKMGRENFHRFLRKWPCPDVELAHAFGDIEANSLFREFTHELWKINHNQCMLGTAYGVIRGNNVLIIGVTIDDKYRVIDTDIIGLFDEWPQVEVLPLSGIALPYSDKTICECRVLPSVSRLPNLYWNAVCKEAKRVAEKIVIPDCATTTQSPLHCN